MAAMDTSEFYCSFCEKECGHKAYFGGRWQKVHTTFIVAGQHRQLGKRQWTYLCRSCDFSLWRDFAKLEEFHSVSHRRAEYMEYLMEQLQKKHM